MTLDTHPGDQASPLSLHRYLYCSANPVNRIDPSGHFDVVEVALAGDLLAGLDSVRNVGALAVQRQVNVPRDLTIDVVDFWNSGATSEIDAYLNEANRAFSPINIKFRIGTTTRASEEEHGMDVEGIHNLRGQGKGQASDDIQQITRRYRKAPNHILAFFFNDWNSDYIERENNGQQIAGEACNFSDFPAPVSPSCFIRSASRERSGLRPFAHELGHLLLDDPYHSYESFNLMNTDSSGSKLTPEQIKRIEGNLSKFQ